MTTSFSERSFGGRATRAAVFGLLALAAVLVQGSEARAQWATSPANANDINSTNNGNVGIGTATPNQKLGVQGMFGIYPQPWVSPTTRGMFMFHDGAGGGIYAFNYPGGTGDPISLSASSLTFSTYIGGTGYQRMIVANNGNVGVGTTAPEAPLHINGWMLSTGRMAGLSFRNRESSTSADDWVWYSSGNVAGFWRTGVGDLLSVTTDGKFGIGTTSPTAKLHVAGDGRLTGNLTVDGNINAKYQDVAEWVPTTQKLAAGTVVILDIARDNHVEASTKSYDTRVAGVVSAQPGIALGEAGEGKALVATTGRVKVKVDATQGAIHVGDLLVTSDKPGVAMLSKPLDLGGVPIHRPGTLIGKALESLDKGTGEILVLLSLQ
jgi:hypothetical protein